MAQLRHLAFILAGLAAPLPLAAQAPLPDIIVTAPRKLPQGMEPVRTTVAISDLNLKTVAGVDTMERRVTAAIKTMCAPPARAAHWQVKDSKACTSHAWENARPQMDGAIGRANSN
ncbi:UrcA family protein [Novosphingobium kunmingense]|uniref:UrcA family protein n=1 Tax=Novosphingobium kunmingense TaxID=1211806 RepID=A0A2N0I1Y3_9SPHN|nr:UrcA family protein [Novosphingobium kunmingense]PKB25197.1 UrcA family protein [Novosphingobium kunmingense]